MSKSVLVGLSMLVCAFAVGCGKGSGGGNGGGGGGATAPAALASGEYAVRVENDAPIKIEFSFTDGSNEKVSVRVAELLGYDESKGTMKVEYDAQARTLVMPGISEKKSAVSPAGLAIVPFLNESAATKVCGANDASTFMLNVKTEKLIKMNYVETWSFTDCADVLRQARDQLAANAGAQIKIADTISGDFSSVFHSGFNFTMKYLNETNRAEKISRITVEFPTMDLVR